MQKNKILLVILATIAAVLLVYTPHYNYPFPRHIDEWHHISEAMKLQQGNYSGGFTGFRVGFHFLLLLLSKITNLVLLYRFLPAVWAGLSALTLFYVVYEKTKKQFYPALFSIIFFASIKSNVNITGLWFFSSLTFSIPFIYLYIHFFTEGIEKQNKKYILISLGIMALLLFTHPISILFAIPFLLIYCLYNLKHIRKEWKFLSIFLIIPIAGILFFKFMLKTPWKLLAQKLINSLQFKRGWGILELNNSPFELYSLIGYILAAIGLFFIFQDKKNLKKYLVYALWPIAVLASIAIYRKTAISFLSPYQRNLYYFALSLPILSALGLDYLLKLAKTLLGKINLAKEKRKIFKKAAATTIVIIITFFTFKSYWHIPHQIDLYKIIDDSEYQALLFLSDLPEKTTVMAPPRISTALFAVSGHRPVATYAFYGNRLLFREFSQARDSRKRQQILRGLNATYILSKTKFNCGWELIYNKKGNYIYKTEIK